MFLIIEKVSLNETRAGRNAGRTAYISLLVRNRFTLFRNWIIKTKISRRCHDIPHIQDLRRNLAHGPKSDERRI